SLATRSILPLVKVETRAQRARGSLEPTFEAKPARLSLSLCRVLFVRSDSLFNSLYRSIQSRAGRRSRLRGLEAQPGRDIHDVFRLLQSQLSRGTRYSSGIEQQHRSRW